MRTILRLFFVALLLLVSAALARASGLDVMMSTVMQQDQSSFSGLGMRARVQPASLRAGLEILPFVEYWRSRSTVEAYDVTIERTDAALGCHVRYLFHASTMNPYLGAGYGIHFLSDDLRASRLGVPDASNSLIKGGVSFLGGATFPLTRTVGTLIDVEYHYLPGISQFKLSWGLGWDF